MDKLSIIHSAERFKIMDSLNTDEIRLYLILLANSGENGAGKISLSVIYGALGDGFSMDRLKAACRRLAECGLIRVPASSLKPINNNDFKLLYKIFPVIHEYPCEKMEMNVRL